MSDQEHHWQPARLIPVVQEQELRATSALLAVLSAVEEFGMAFVRPFGAPKGKLEAFTEVSFEFGSDRISRPDGLLRVRRGKRTWIALVEVKTGNNDLNKQQIEDYLDVAMEQGFDCVVTISNQIAKIPGGHPLSIDRRKLRRVALHHVSWSKIRTEAVMQKTHRERGVADPRFMRI